MILYDGGRAPNPRRVQIFMAEKGIELETIQLDLNSHEQKTLAFQQINPMMRVPVLQLDDGSHISETVAICRYLEGMVAEPNLMGRDYHEAAIIEMWQRRVEFGFLLNVGNAFRHLHPAGKILEPEQFEDFGRKAQKLAREFMQFLDDELAKRQYIAGDRFTIADITGFVAYQFLKPGRIAQPDDLHNLVSWYERVNGRASTAFR